MRSVTMLSFASVCLVVANSHAVVAQQLKVRRVQNAIVQVQTEQGLSFLILPSSDVTIPKDLTSERTFVLGSKFDTTFMQFNGDAPVAALHLKLGEPVPSNTVSIGSDLIGEKQAGIQVKTERLNILFVQVDIMSEQGWITTHRDQDINLLVLSFKNAATLNNARTNLWLGLLKAQQIALNPAGTMSVEAMEEFYRSLGTKRVLPTGVLPMVEVPNRNLNFGDRQVVLLKELD